MCIPRNKLLKSIETIEIGGEFQWANLPEGPFLPWPKSHLFFASARSAILSLWKEKSSKIVDNSFFIPDYFCPNTYTFWKEKGIRIRQYEDDPRWSHPNWDTIASDSGNFVLAVNYFGIRNGTIWKEWHKKNPQIILIEDHSHDPFSTWAQTSTADYAFASIRKTFPVPDGAILWSPQNNPLPSVSENQNWSGGAIKLAGMILKSEYLKNPKKHKGLKEIFRKFQVEGEELLSNGEDLSISALSNYLLSRGFPKNWRIQREKNIRLLLNLLTDCHNFKPLFSNWPSDYCPFNAVLVFNTEMYRETFRHRLISKGIFTPVHWALEAVNDGHDIDLSRRILTIPADHRYRANDMQYIADIIKEIDESI